MPEKHFYAADYAVANPSYGSVCEGGRCCENRNGIIQEELDFSLEAGGHRNPLRTQIFRVCLFDEQTMVDRNLNVFDCGSLADVRHELMQFGFVEDVVVLQPHLGEQIVVVQIVEEFVAQNVHPVLIRKVDQLNELATPRVRVPLEVWSGRSLCLSRAFYGVNIDGRGGKEGEGYCMLYYMQFYMYNYSPSRVNLITRVAHVEFVHIEALNC